MENCTENQSDLANAVNVLTDALRKDKSLRQAYVANIAMAFKDKYDHYKNEKGLSVLDSQDIHNIANGAAEYFIQVLCDEIQYPEGR
ncbi:hypothetical protein [Runella sp.]|uniref:hypothetical protein n=1 Tax=Runella sp. TaxID=1960881 RepID=UPI003D14A08B